MVKRTLVALLTNNDDDVYCFRLELIQRILREGYDLLISCPDGPKFSAMERQGLKKGKQYIYDDPPIDRRGTNPINDGRLFIHYYRLLKKYRPAVVLAYTPKPNVYAGLAANFLHIPVISNVTGLGSVEKETGLKKTLIMSLFKSAYRKAAWIMFQNSTNLSLARKEGWIKNEYKLIPGSGVALDRFPVLEYPDGGNGVTGSVVVFNYIGRILHDKGIDDYLAAAMRVRRKFPKTEFNIIGFIEPSENHYEKDLKKLEKQGFVRYRGSQIDVRPWIGRSHCTIHPSTYGEGISNVLLESAACARPVITTDNPGCRETVNDCISGFVYHGGDVDALVNRIEAFLKDLPNQARIQMGLEGRKKVEQEFSREIVIKSYMDAIKQLLV